MKPALQQVLFAFAFVALAIHFAFIVSYSNPFLSGGSVPPYRVQWYAYPFFHQGWNLFVPAPRNNYHVYVQCRDKEGAVSADVLHDALRKHRQNPLLGYGGIVVSITNSIHYFEQNTKQRKAVNGPVRGDLNFSILEKLAISYLRWTGKCPAKAERLILLVEDPSGNRIYFN
jgi:hypothetical protein